MLKKPKIRDEKHRRFIASLPCVLCSGMNVQAAHIRIGNNAGMALKSGDDCCLPLCITHHKQQHECGEVSFWYPHGGHEKANVLAKALYACTGDEIEAQEKIKEWKWKKQ